MLEPVRASTQRQRLGPHNLYSEMNKNDNQHDASFSIESFLVSELCFQYFGFITLILVLFFQLGFSLKKILTLTPNNSKHSLYFYADFFLS